MPEILFVVDITDDDICCKKKSPAYIVAVALYFYLYFLFLVNGSKGVLCYSYLYVNWFTGITRFIVMKQKDFIHISRSIILNTMAF